ncbi:prepilin-type N-terminal cleavage/methylation domain-containing protein [Sporosarcina sp. E16_3]|uniref:prepilin-type N-terminal cleavage/methylation domain-containing protein n=1 Tax=Sporosarcina sp. E16_3 TaxID=2789293 RepID=UPI001A9388CD|nr:prepilin-type N-terminal cleavage/methylation domain-containing protein [Sporosarcina sp. E16_3]MBO0601330.1 prepilin-type N-terminal cleavage/methylation domain-containing protein [Sporosarcina sp. E16_3]
MKKFLQKRLNNEKGLTLVELLAVIVILGIIAAIAIPSVGNVVTNSRVNALKADGQNILAAANLYFVENGSIDTFPVTSDTLIKDGFLDDDGGFTVHSQATVTKSSASGGNIINGTATYGSVKVVFNNATNADINNTGTKQAGAASTITITR